jgi:hypothetical protein
MSLSGVTEYFGGWVFTMLRITPSERPALTIFTTDSFVKASCAEARTTSARSKLIIHIKPLTG